MNFTRNRNWKIIQNRNLRVQNQRFRIWAKTGDGTGEDGAGRLAGRILAAAATGHEGEEGEEQEGDESNLLVVLIGLRDGRSGSPAIQ